MRSFILFLNTTKIEKKNRIEKCMYVCQKKKDVISDVTSGTPICINEKPAI